MMIKESISITSTVVNLILALLKLLVGFWVKSAALIADGIHSGLDIISSFVTYLGIKIARRPADQKHPYGHYRSETIAGFAVTFLLLISALWIIYEGVFSIISGEPHKIGLWALLVVFFSIIVNEGMARIKFKIGKQANNLALIADAEHSRADSISSIAVLIGLIFTRWFIKADGLTAILVGLYILYETYLLSKEIVDNLLDIANPQIEEQIERICQKQEISLLDIKTRKIGAQNFAELKIGLDPSWKMSKVEQITKKLQNFLIDKIESLKFVIIQVVSHNLRQGYIKSQLGIIKPFRNLPQKIYFGKKGRRTIVPVEKNKIYPIFGAPSYLIFDQDKKGNILQKRIIKNPYFFIGRGHGMRFVREVKADKVMAKEIGQNAVKILKDKGIIFKKIDEENEEIKNILSQ
jgi:cation diffusion facilitator family transporter